MKFRKKPIIVDAVQAICSRHIVTPHGSVLARTGDWIVTDPATGDTWPVANWIFAATYEPVGAGGKE